MPVRFHSEVGIRRDDRCVDVEDLDAAVEYEEVARFVGVLHTVIIGVGRPLECALSR
jgi:hypothetical protein